MQKVQKSKRVELRSTLTRSEELVDTLIAISVVAKRIASKLQTNNRKGGQSDVKDERTVGSA